MPQRFLKPGLTNSRRWNSIGFPAQSLYIRLLTLVDDYGRCDGRASVVHGSCFSVWNELHEDCQLSFSDVRAMLGELCNVGLIDWYRTHDGEKDVIQLLQWTERIRPGTRPKWPEVTETCSKLQQVAASCMNFQPPPPPPSPPPAPAPSGAHPQVEVEATLLSMEEAIEQANMRCMIPKDFAKHVYEDWSSRGGKDGNGVLVTWLPYCQKRWSREQEEWKNGTHKGKQKNNGTHRSSSQSHIKDRNEGTYNAGRGKEYEDHVREKQAARMAESQRSRAAGDAGGSGAPAQ